MPVFDVPFELSHIRVFAELPILSAPVIESPALLTKAVDAASVVR